jgi:hypothetical protein
MFNQIEVKKWMESSCPLFWSLLNSQAQGSIPNGLIEYIGDGSPSQIEAGRTNLATIERHLTDLKNLCGWQAVRDKYRRQLSSVDSENQVSELLCEIALCASVGKLSGRLQLHPPTGKGTHSDCHFYIDGFEIYGEVKRCHDPWPLIEKPGEVLNKEIPYFRSISERPSNEKPHDSARPKAMDLKSKLRNVHRQFPEMTINVLFLFHSSFGETMQYITQALFGDSNFFKNKDNFVLEADGLYSIDEWRNISACCLVRCDPESKIIFPFVWKNPRAVSGIPKSVLEALSIDEILGHHDN